MKDATKILHECKIDMPLPVLSLDVHESRGSTIWAIAMDASGVKNAPRETATVDIIFRADEEVNVETMAAKLRVARRVVQNNIDAIS